jgi:hypothetical protein
MSSPRTTRTTSAPTASSSASRWRASPRASREQAGIEQDEAGQALRSLGMTPSAEKPASLVGLPPP